METWPNQPRLQEIQLKINCYLIASKSPARNGISRRGTFLAYRSKPFHCAPLTNGFKEERDTGQFCAAHTSPDKQKDLPRKGCSKSHPAKLLNKGLEQKDTNSHLSHDKRDEVMWPWRHRVLLPQETAASCLHADSLKNKTIPAQGKEINLSARSTGSVSCIQSAKTKHAKGNW